jgi:hypothetical protein
MSDRLLEEVQRLQKDLEKSLAKDEPTERIMDILKGFEKLKFTSAVIVSSKIANTINATKKKFATNAAVKGLCKQLIQTWKSVYKNETLTEGVATPSSSAHTAALPAASAPGAVKTTDESTAPASSSSSKASSPVMSPPPSLRRVESNRSDIDDAEDCEKMVASYPDGRRKVS